MSSLAGKTLFITGASRGIGLAIALRAARDGANVALIAKTAEPHPKLPGTIFTAAAQIEADKWFAKAGVDLLFEAAVAGGLKWYDLGGIDPDGNPGVYRFKARMGGSEVRAGEYAGHAFGALRRRHINADDFGVTVGRANERSRQRAIGFHVITEAAGSAQQITVEDQDPHA